MFGKTRFSNNNQILVYDSNSNNFFSTHSAFGARFLEKLDLRNFIQGLYPRCIKRKIQCACKLRKTIDNGGFSVIKWCCKGWHLRKNIFYDNRLKT